MTGKELILYILLNDLENTVVLDGGTFLGFLSEFDVAAKFGVGVATIRTWHACNMISGIPIGDLLYFRKDVTDPRITSK